MGQGLLRVAGGCRGGVVDLGFRVGRCTALDAGQLESQAAGYAGSAVLCRCFGLHGMAEAAMGAWRRWDLDRGYDERPGDLCTRHAACRLGRSDHGRRTRRHGDCGAHVVAWHLARWLVLCRTVYVSACARSRAGSTSGHQPGATCGVLDVLLAHLAKRAGLDWTSHSDGLVSSRPPSRGPGRTRTVPCRELFRALVMSDHGVARRRNPAACRNRSQARGERSVLLCPQPHGGRWRTADSWRCADVRSLVSCIDSDRGRAGLERHHPPSRGVWSGRPIRQQLRALLPASPLLAARRPLVVFRGSH